MEINHVVVLSGDRFSPRDFYGSFSDTLLKARKVFFQFDLIMLFHKDYELKKIEIAGGQLNILYDRKGFHNLNVWKSNESSGQEQHSLNLQSISVSDMNIRYIDLNNRISLVGHSGKTSFRGLYAKNILSGDARGIFSNTSLLIRNKLWMNNADLEVQLKMLYASDRFRISQGILKLNKAEINVQGEYKGGRRKQIDLSLGFPDSDWGN